MIGAAEEERRSKRDDRGGLGNERYMDAEKIFVGRKAELEQFKTVLENPQGQAF